MDDDGEHCSTWKLVEIWAGSGDTAFEKSDEGQLRSDGGQPCSLLTLMSELYIQAFIPHLQVGLEGRPEDVGGPGGESTDTTGIVPGDGPLNGELEPLESGDENESGDLEQGQLDAASSDKGIS